MTQWFARWKEGSVEAWLVFVDERHLQHSVVVIPQHGSGVKLEDMLSSCVAQCAEGSASRGWLFLVLPC